MSRGDSHKCVVDADGKSRRGDPVDGEEEVHWLEALYVEIKVYATKFVENKVSDNIRALNLYSEAKPINDSDGGGNRNTNTPCP